MWMNDFEGVTCFERAKEGFVRLLGEDSAKAVNAALSVASQLPSADEMITEYRRLWEMAKVSLPDEAVTYEIANDLGIKLDDEGKYEAAKVFYLAALEGRRRVLGDKHKDTLATMNNMGALLKNMEDDYEGALDYYQQALRVQEKVLGKTHPDTLTTIMNMAITYMEGLEDFTKAEEMYRQALDGHEKALGKDHKDTKGCALNFALMLRIQCQQDDLQELLTAYPHIEDDEEWISFEGDDDDDDEEDDNEDEEGDYDDDE
jgi:tetratricopeptide (TPR) repeat protein